MQQIKKLSSWVEPWNNSVTTSRASALLLPISQWRFFLKTRCVQVINLRFLTFLIGWGLPGSDWPAALLLFCLMRYYTDTTYTTYIITYKNSGRKRNTPSSHLNHSNIILNFFFIFHILFSKFLMHESFSSHRVYHILHCRQLFCNRQEVPKCV